ncbi:hypothetical protein [Salirhabdus sp. Marseille-P4669]|nr:hypothetical protein [Salirhabdus sp. Marseille-P4669]
MDITREEKSARLEVMLQEALKPLHQKIDNLEKELKVIKDNQGDIKQSLK